MKNPKFLLPAIFVFMLMIFSCTDESENPDSIQLLINSSVEAGSSTPNKWFDFPGDYQASWTDAHAFSGSKSLMIQSLGNDGKFGYWVQSIYKDIPYGRRLRLSAMIRLDGVDPANDGVSIVIRGDDDEDPDKSAFFYTTQGDVPIRGDEDWKEYTLEMKANIPETVDKIHVFLVLLDDTEGTVYFDDIKLETVN
jgi:hypothetical protein